LNNQFTNEIVDLLPIGVMVMDANLEVRMWNTWLEGHTEVSSESALNKTLAQLFPKFDNMRFEWAVTNVIQSKSPQILSQSLNHFVIPISIEHAKQHGILFMQQHVEIVPIVTTDDSVMALITVIDVTANVLRSSMLVEMVDRLEYEEFHDEIPNVYNRRYLWEWLRTQFILAENQRYDISCILLELDEVTNDTSTVLAEIAKLIRIPLRKSDLLIRYADTNFAAMLPCCHVADAVMVAEKICSLVKETAIGKFKAGEITCSMGVSVWTSCAPCTGEELLKKADRNLYKAINGGGSQVQGPLLNN
jgi:diguanylate cyclase